LLTSSSYDKALAHDKQEIAVNEDLRTKAKLEEGNASFLFLFKLTKGSSHGRVPYNTTQQKDTLQKIPKKQKTKKTR